MTNLASILENYRQRIHTKLADIIINTPSLDPKLNKAMAYATLNGGKRLRPTLVYMTGAAFNLDLDLLDNAAAAIECIHCYSLIHDDLPSMDDDDLRRGKPTCHIAFDEATAILAGDALQTLAFTCLTNYLDSALSPQTQINMVKLLATASGSNGMVAGQSLDLQAEGQSLSLEALDQIHQLKTGALIQTSILLGATAAECQDESILSALRDFGSDLGLIFQLQDDLLDSIGNATLLGKNTGQDSKQQKATYTTLFGEAFTRNRIESLMQKALKTLDQLPLNTDELKALCENLLKRQH